MKTESPSNPEQDRALNLLETAIDRRFGEQTLLERAVTHRSFVHESSDPTIRHNESLEFLGDSILGFVVSEELYRRFPAAAEGSLSKAKAYLVSAASLHRLARELDLGRYLRLSSGEDKTGGRRKRALLVDAYEALIAAIYVDGGIEAARGFILRQLQPALARIDVEKVRYEDFKSTLQEKLHQLRLPDPVYRVIEELGPDHAKTFVVELKVGEELSATAAGRTKKEAQQNAAREALGRLSGPQHSGQPENGEPSCPGRQCNAPLIEHG